MSWVITPTYDGLVSDADATAYLAAVQAADGQLLEPAVRIAVNNFIAGCKADGIWTAIKASCILAGARTLTGALVPLVGVAPTNFNFVSGDYNRKTGLVGDGSTKYIASSRLNNADPQDSNHNAIYATTVGTNAFIGGGTTGSGANNIASGVLRNRSSASQSASGSATGFRGIERSTSATFVYRVNGISSTFSISSQGPSSDEVFVFARSSGTTPSFYGNHRIAFYSIGESLDLALLDARVTTLINAFDAAI